MVNIFTGYMSFLSGLMKLFGMRPQLVEIEPGTVMNFWVPKTHNHQAENKSNKPVLVFLHGFGMNGILTWQFQVLFLDRNKYSIYVPDFLFFGGSFTSKLDRSPEFQAECVAKGLRKLGVELCSLVGFSYGGVVGFKMAELYPDMVSSMVITGSVMALTESISKAGRDRIGFSSWADYLLPQTIIGLKQMFDIAAYKWPWIPNFIYKHSFEVLFQRRKERTELLDALITRDNDFRIPCYSQNIHLLWGENDRIFNMEVAYNLKKQLKDKATIHYIEKAGHLVPIERPFAYNSCLNKILASISENNQK